MSKVTKAKPSKAARVTFEEHGCGKRQLYLAQARRAGWFLCGHAARPGGKL